MKSEQGRQMGRRVLIDIGVVAAVVTMAVMLSTFSFSYGSDRAQAKAEAEAMKVLLADHESRISHLELLPEKIDRLLQNQEDMKIYFGIPHHVINHRSK